MTERTKTILELYSNGHSVSEIAKLFNVTPQRIYDIFRKEREKKKLTEDFPILLSDNNPLPIEVFNSVRYYTYETLASKYPYKKPKDIEVTEDDILASIEELVNNPELIDRVRQFGKKSYGSLKLWWNDYSNVYIGEKYA